MDSGMKLTGNQAPPMALMMRMAKVEIPRAASGVEVTAAITMPKAVQAAAANVQTRSSIGTWWATSIP